MCVCVYVWLGVCVWGGGVPLIGMTWNLAQ